MSKLEAKQDMLIKSSLELWPEVVADNVIITECDAVAELEDVLGDFPSENLMSKMNREEITEWVKVEDGEVRENILIGEAIIQYNNTQR